MTNTNDSLTSKLWQRFESIRQSIAYDRIDQSLTTNLRESNPNIYHYTNYEGLQSILKSRILRLTDYKYLNDPTELLYGQEIIKRAILNSDIPRNHLLDKVIGFIEDFNNTHNIYIASLSLKKNKLSLWRYYANNGTGFAIGFKDYFKNINNSGGSFENTIISQVHYGEEVINTILNRYISKYHEILSESVDQDLLTLTLILISEFISLTPSFKHGSFSEEEEIRLMRIEGQLDSNTQKRSYFDNKDRVFIPFSTQKYIHFVTAIQGNKPAVLLHKFEDSSISEIIIGPACNFIEAKSTIETFLTDSGYNVNEIRFEQEKSPIRNI